MVGDTRVRVLVSRLELGVGKRETMAEGLVVLPVLLLLVGFLEKERLPPALLLFRPWNVTSNR